jgi:hypothetical protein
MLLQERRTVVLALRCCWPMVVDFLAALVRHSMLSLGVWESDT